MEDFIKKLTEACELTDGNSITPETLFRDLDDWSSFAALSLIAFADEEYEKEISGSDIKNAKTIQDLYNLITSK